MEVSMTEPLLSGRIRGAMALGGGGSVPALGSTWPGAMGGAGFPVGIDADVGDIKMSVRVADHVEGAIQWFLCDGRAVNRLTYAQLFALVGITYGAGDGLTTFNIPQYTNDGVVTGRSPAGISGAVALGQKVGALTHVHGLNVIHADVHVWNPTNETIPDPFPLTNNAGVPVQSFGAHWHVVAGVEHPLPVPDTDGETDLSPYLAVCFFIRVS